jgi:hypothetical protein
MTLGGTGGNVKHTLLKTETPSHSHGIPFNDNGDVIPFGKFVQIGYTSPSYFNTTSKGGDHIETHVKWGKTTVTGFASR